ncbi:MAG TPA: O-antigen ligase family protein [Candidatus Bathyarchaeia archaeon]|nr:O-antigen ligase family protein [Candidatus Bathyarchaeia archaeon]
MSTRATLIPLSKTFLGDRVALALGLLAAGFGTAFVLAHWSFAVLCGIVVVLLAAAENERFLLVLVFLIPINWIAALSFPLVGDTGRLDVATTVRLLAVGGFLGGRLLRDRLRFSEMRKVTLTRMSLLLAGVAFASLVLGGYGLTYDSVKAIVRLLSYIGFYLLLLVWMDSEARLRKVALTILGSTLFAACFGILQELIGGYTSFWLFLNPPSEWFVPMDYRAPSFFANCNFFAGYLNLVLPFSIGCWVVGEGRWKRLGAWTTGLGTVALLCTQSLGGIVAFGGIVILAILCFAGDWKKKLTLLVTLCVLAAGFYFGKAVLNPAHEGQGFSYDQAIRLVLWGIAGDFFRQSPLLGVGWGNFTALYGSYVTDISWIPAGQFEVHNIYLQLLAETGLIGFGTFFLMIYRAVQQGLRQLHRYVEGFDKALAFGVLGAILAVLLHGLVDFFFLVSPQFGTLFWVLLALLVASGRKLGGTLARVQAVG